MLSTEFSTSFWKLKRKIRIFQDGTLPKSFQIILSHPNFFFHHH